MDFDPVQWEIEQLDKLKKLSEASYGWDEEDKQYNSRVKLIQKQSIARQKVVLLLKESRESSASSPPPRTPRSPS